MDQIPETVKESLDNLIGSFKDILGGNLVGAYLHGGITMGSFNPDSSDLDVLVVVEDKVTVETKKKLYETILSASQNLPAKGFDISVAIIDAIRNFQYPTPREFYFNYTEPVSISEDVVFTTDLVSDFVNIKERGVCLYGTQIQDLFADIPKQYYLLSIAKNAEWCFDRISEGQEEGTCRVPAYCVLSLCRTLAFIKDSIITSKKEGGEWGLLELPEQYKPIIQEALNEYIQAGTARSVDSLLLKRFATYAWGVIKSA